MRHRAEQAAQGAAVGIDAAGVLPDGDEDVLGDVLGDLLVADDPQGEAVDEAGELVVELFEGGLVAAAESLDERPLGPGASVVAPSGWSSPQLLFAAGGAAGSEAGVSLAIPLVGARGSWCPGAQGSSTRTASTSVSSALAPDRRSLSRVRRVDTTFGTGRSPREATRPHSSSSFMGASAWSVKPSV